MAPDPREIIANLASERDYEHVATAGPILTASDHADAILAALDAAGYELVGMPLEPASHPQWNALDVARARADAAERAVPRLEQVGWQWIDDGIADGGLLPLDTSLARGDTRCKPVFRVIPVPEEDL